MVEDEDEDEDFEEEGELDNVEEVFVSLVPSRVSTACSSSLGLRK